MIRYNQLKPLDKIVMAAPPPTTTHHLNPHPPFSPLATVLLPTSAPQTTAFISEGGCNDSDGSVPRQQLKNSMVLT
jgi:hypothetical protein